MEQRGASSLVLRRAAAHPVSRKQRVARLRPMDFFETTLERERRNHRRSSEQTERCPPQKPALSRRVSVSRRCVSSRHHRGDFDAAPFAAHRRGRTARRRPRKHRRAFVPRFSGQPEQAHRVLVRGDEVAFRRAAATFSVPLVVQPTSNRFVYGARRGAGAFCVVPHAPQVRCFERDSSHPPRRVETRNSGRTGRRVCSKVYAVGPVWDERHHHKVRERLLFFKNTLKNDA